ncbi:hypothetical protein MPH_08700 [Macrophomina phaseolina MS6]|uniref:Uncharacterized protein n=1 Tax=Macrophomina phaseolina (strain MS6) TaxID=1126212 RepID=K2RVE0_MACPH|nr:hypothetical protein MPH_08700 [Macrophomina phaseolina MS6]
MSNHTRNDYDKPSSKTSHRPKYAADDRRSMSPPTHGRKYRRSSWSASPARRYGRRRRRSPSPYYRDDERRSRSRSQAHDYNRGRRARSRSSLRYRSYSPEGRRTRRWTRSPSYGNHDYNKRSSHGHERRGRSATPTRDDRRDGYGFARSSNGREHDYKYNYRASYPRYGNERPYNYNNQRRRTPSPASRRTRQDDSPADYLSNPNLVPIAPHKRRNIGRATYDGNNSKEEVKFRGAAGGRSFGFPPARERHSRSDSDGGDAHRQQREGGGYGALRCQRKYEEGDVYLGKHAVRR